MAGSKKLQYKYTGKRRPEMIGTVKWYSESGLTEEMVKRLEERGWEKVEKKKAPMKEDS